MYVKFEYTEDDLVDTLERFLERSKTARAARVKGALYSALFGGVVAFFICAGKSYTAAGIAAVVAAVLAALIHRVSFEGSRRRRLRKLIREQHGRFDRRVCEVELTPVGVRVRRDNVQSTYEWESVEEVAATPDSVDIHARGGGVVVVRARAFENEAERRRFKGLAEGYLELSRTGSAARSLGADGGGVS
jgi:hypothetical protein